MTTQEKRTKRGIVTRMAKALRFRLALAWLAFAGLTLAPLPALADEAQGEGMVVERNLATGTLVLDDGSVLRVDDRTRITDGNGQQLELSEVPVTGDSGPGEWRHGDLPSTRWASIEVPVDEREVVRHKSFAAAPMTTEEAWFDLDLLGHDFYLYIDAETGAEAVVTAGDDGPVVHYAKGTDESPPAPLYSQRSAKEALDVSGAPWLFFRASTDGRGQVLYRRYDGHYGLVTLAP